LDAERRGTLKPGGTVVEGTAGNTGIGLAHVCNARGYKCVIVMPDNQAAEKYQIIEALGAELRKVPAVPYSNPNQYQKVRGAPGPGIARRHFGPINSTIPQTRDAHFESTGPEIWARYRREDRRLLRVHRYGRHAGRRGPVPENPNPPAVRIVLVDPPGSALYHYIKDGELKSDGGSSITEGIGTGRVTAKPRGARPSTTHCASPMRKPCTSSIGCCAKEGLLLGSTAGINVAAAVTLAKQMGRGHTIVTVLCDGGAKYQSRLFQQGLDRRARLR